MSTATYSVASVGAGYTYNWVTPSGMTIQSGQTTTSITVSCPQGTASTVGTLKVNSINACGNSSAIRSMNVTRCLGPVPMNGNKYNFSSIYPNPASTVFTVELTSAANDEITVEVYDILGNSLIQQKHPVVEGENNILTDIEQLKDGMYFVRILDSNSNAVLTQRVIKQ
jgi:hypothetical protein